MSDPWCINIYVFSSLLQSSLVSTINFRLCFVNPPNFYRITPKLTFMKYVLYLHVRIVARGQYRDLTYRLTQGPVPVSVSRYHCNTEAGTSLLSGSGAFQLKLSKMFPLFWIREKKMWAESCAVCQGCRELSANPLMWRFMHKTYKWKLRGFFWLFNLILQLDNFIKSYLRFSFCGLTFEARNKVNIHKVNNFTSCEEE